MKMYIFLLKNFFISILCGWMLSCSFIQWACLVLRGYSLPISPQILCVMANAPQPQVAAEYPTHNTSASPESMFIFSSNNVQYFECICRIKSADSFAVMSGAPSVPLYLFIGPIASLLLICIPKSPPGRGWGPIPFVWHEYLQYYPLINNIKSC